MFQGRAESRAVGPVRTLSTWRMSPPRTEASLSGPEHFYRVPLSWLRSPPSSTGWEMRPKEDRFPLGGDTAFQKALVEAAGAAVRLCRGHAHSIQESVLPFPPCGFWGIKLRSPGLRASTFTLRDPS